MKRLLFALLCYLLVFTPQTVVWSNSLSKTKMFQNETPALSIVKFFPKKDREPLRRFIVKNKISFLAKIEFDSLNDVATITHKNHTVRVETVNLKKREFRVNNVPYIDDMRLPIADRINLVVNILQRTLKPQASINLFEWILPTANANPLVLLERGLQLAVSVLFVTGYANSVIPDENPRPASLYGETPLACYKKSEELSENKDLSKVTIELRTYLAHYIETVESIYPKAECKYYSNREKRQVCIDQRTMLQCIESLSSRLKQITDLPENNDPYDRMSLYEKDNDDYDLHLKKLLARYSEGLSPVVVEEPTNGTSKSEIASQ